MLSRGSRWDFWVPVEKDSGKERNFSALLWNEKKASSHARSRGNQGNQGNQGLQPLLWVGGSQGCWEGWASWCKLTLGGGRDGDSKLMRAQIPRQEVSVPSNCA